MQNSWCKLTIIMIASLILFICPIYLIAEGAPGSPSGTALKPHGEKIFKIDIQGAPAGSSMVISGATRSEFLSIPCISGKEIYTAWLKGTTVHIPVSHIISITEFDSIDSMQKAIASNIGQK